MLNATRSGMAVALGLAAMIVGTVHAQNPPPRPPVPRPFPGASAPPTVQAPEPPPGDATLGGAPVYPTAEFLESFDAGSGQRYFLYGTNSDFETIVGYYRNVLRNGGREIFRAPAMQQFELGRFNEDSMAFPPSVVVKDYSGGATPGYLFVDGTSEKRYLTIIQIVPAPGTEPGQDPSRRN